MARYLGLLFLVNLLYFFYLRRSRGRLLISVLTKENPVEAGLSGSFLLLCYLNSVQHRQLVSVPAEGDASLSVELSGCVVKHIPYASNTACCIDRSQGITLCCPGKCCWVDS